MQLKYSVLLSAATVLVGIVEASPIKATQTEATFPTYIGHLGSTATAEAPFLAQTDTAAQVTGPPPKNQHPLPQPIEFEMQSFDHCKNDRSIYELFATISPYYVLEEGFGVYNYALPEQCSIKQVHFLQRHGARYPDLSFKFPVRLAASQAAGNFTATGKLQFLEEWKLKLGKNILTTLGNQQLFNNGVKAFFRYGKLFDWDKKGEEKIVARTTSEERMTKTALYFLNGFFGLDWEDYVDLELLVEDTGYNNTLASWNDCPNNDFSYDKINYSELEQFKVKYLKDAVERFNKDIDGFTFTESDLFEIQTICSYETNILGASKFCPLFSQLEWESFEYYQSANWYVQNSFANPMGRALGIGWVQEFIDRLTNTTYSPATQAEQNSTLDSNPLYFPLDQSLYMDFTHDSSIHNIITALGFEQFKANWTFKGPREDKQFYDLSRITPFAAQLAFEIIECDTAVPVDRNTASAKGSSSTQYVHALLNDNTLSLPLNVPGGVCEDRVDGWCELGNFTQYLNTLWDVAQYDLSCNGDYNYTLPVTNGVPFS